MKKNLFGLVIMLICIIPAVNAQYRDWDAEKEAFAALCSCTAKLFNAHNGFNTQVAHTIKELIAHGARPVYYDLQLSERHTA